MVPSDRVAVTVIVYEVPSSSMVNSLYRLSIVSIIESGSPRELMATEYSVASTTGLQVIVMLVAVISLT